MTISRGLAALILTFIFSSNLFAEYLYKDEVIFIEHISDEIEVIGKELREKTGIGLYAVVLKELENNQTIVEYEKSLANELQAPFVLLTVSEFDKQIDILARPTDLYKYFDKNQVLSPMPNSGTIVPILTMKAKKAPTNERYAAAVLNGYTDLAEQIADAKGVELESAPGSPNKMVFNVLRILFYGMILYAFYLWIKRKLLTRKSTRDE